LEASISRTPQWRIAIPPSAIRAMIIIPQGARAMKRPGAGRVTMTRQHELILSVPDVNERVGRMIGR